LGKIAGGLKPTLRRLADQASLTGPLNELIDRVSGDNRRPVAMQ